MPRDDELKTVSLTSSERSQCRLALDERITHLYGFDPPMQDQINEAFQAYLKMGGYFELSFLKHLADKYGKNKVRSG